MQRNLVRIIVNSFVCFAILTLLLILMNKTPLLYSAYGCSIFAVITFACALGFWARGSKIKYVLHAAYPMMVFGYLACSLGFSVLMVLVELIGWSMPYGWFLFIHLIILAIFAWRITSLDAACEAIGKTETAIKLQTVGWKMIVVDMAAVAGRAAAADRIVLQKVADAMRYADPMEHDGVAREVSEIGDNVRLLGTLVDSGKSEEIVAVCAVIERLIRERHNKLLILK